MLLSALLVLLLFLLVVKAVRLLLVLARATGEGGSRKAWEGLELGAGLLMLLFRRELASGVALRLLQARCASRSRA